MVYRPQRLGSWQYCASVCGATPGASARLGHYSVKLQAYRCRYCRLGDRYLGFSFSSRLIVLVEVAHAEEAHAEEVGLSEEMVCQGRSC